MTETISVPLVHGPNFFNIKTDTFILSGTSDGYVQIAIADDYVDLDAMKVTIIPGEGPSKVQFEYPESSPVRVVHGRLKLSVGAAKLLIAHLEQTVTQVEDATKDAKEA